MTQHKVIKRRPGGPIVGSIGTHSDGVFEYLGKSYPIDGRDMHDEYLKEVVESKVPDSFECLGIVGGYYTRSDYKVFFLSNKLIDGETRATQPTKELAEAQLAKAQLAQLMYRTRENCDNRKPHRTDRNQEKWVIYYYCNEIATNDVFGHNVVLAFATKEIRDEFLEKHRGLITKARLQL